MPDREKVIKALDEHLHCSGRGKSGYCPYSDDELWNDISDALELLKEQGPVISCIDDLLHFFDQLYQRKVSEVE